MDLCEGLNLSNIDVGKEEDSSELLDNVVLTSSDEMSTDAWVPVYYTENDTFKFFNDSFSALMHLYFIEADFRCSLMSLDSSVSGYSGVFTHTASYSITFYSSIKENFMNTLRSLYKTFINKVSKDIPISSNVVLNLTINFGGSNKVYSLSISGDGSDISYSVTSAHYDNYSTAYGSSLKHTKIY